MFEVGEGAAFVSGEALTLLLAEPRRNSCNRAPHEAPVLTRSRSLWLAVAQPWERTVRPAVGHYGCALLFTTGTFFSLTSSTGMCVT